MNDQPHLPPRPQNSLQRASVLFVCLGNICRSPTAEAVFKHRAKKEGLSIWCDSAGTGGWHHGDAPDGRSLKAGRARGYSFAGQTSRKIIDQDFEDFDFILAMDAQNLRDLQNICPSQHQEKLALFLDFAPHTDLSEVPDPYYSGSIDGDMDGFTLVINLIEMASEGLIKYLKG